MSDCSHAAQVHKRASKLCVEGLDLQLESEVARPAKALGMHHTFKMNT